MTTQFWLLTGQKKLRTTTKERSTAVNKTYRAGTRITEWDEDYRVLCYKLPPQTYTQCVSLWLPPVDRNELMPQQHANCIPGTDLLRLFSVFPHCHTSCRLYVLWPGEDKSRQKDKPLVFVFFAYKPPPPPPIPSPHPCSDLRSCMDKVRSLYLTLSYHNHCFTTETDRWETWFQISLTMHTLARSLCVMVKLLP